MVYYRKYRPQTITELDLSDVREKLTSILSSKEIPHAFLFTGPRGLGKTSSARILAKAINCQNTTGIEPCNKCEICLSITEGGHIDIIEIDAASNRGVDEIRNLREKVKFSPSQLSKKVYIIDEVHMLTNEAFNALLKTLEEPPAHVIFILATTEVNKIPQTILSRVFEVKFEKPTISEITNSLKRIIKGENLEVDEDIFPKLFELSEGSFRDGAKIMEELSLNSDGKKIDAKLLEKVFKSGSTSVQTDKLLEVIYKKDMDKGLKIISEMANEGMDFKIVIEQLVEKIRNDLVSGNAKLEVSDAKRILTLLNEAYVSLKSAVVAQLPLELAIIEYTIQENEKENTRIQEVAKDNVAQKDVVKPIQQSVKPQTETNYLLKSLIESVHLKDKRVAALLRSCNEAILEKEDLILLTPYSFHAQKLSQQEFSEMILESAQALNSKIKSVTIKTS